MIHTIYQAGPLFSEAERTWHIQLSGRLKAAGHTVIWPGALLSEEVIRAAGSKAIPLIFETCKNALDHCTCVLALLDGTQVDDGTAWEIGYAYAKGLPVYGIRTDSRVAGDTPHNRVNSMIEGGLTGIAGNTKELIAMLCCAL